MVVIQHESQYGEPDITEINREISSTEKKEDFDKNRVADDHLDLIYEPEENKPDYDSDESRGVMGSSGFPVLPNHIEEYLKESVGENAFRDLFEAEEDNVDLRTELNENEVDCVNKIFINNEFLYNKLGFDIYKEFLNNYMRLKVSFNRGSRSEFVDINRRERFEQNLSRFSNFQNLSKVKE